MKKPEIPAGETDRLKALHALCLLDTKPEPSYDAITKLIKYFFDVPIVAISLVDAERQWFKSIQGLDVCETSRDVSFCGHTILQDDFFIVEDTLLDDRFSDNPLVTEEPKIRFYTGVPLKNASGYKVGSLCIIDTKPRHFPREKLQYLKDFSLLIEDEFFEKRRSAAYLGEIAKIQEIYIKNTAPEKLFSYILDFLLRHTNSEYGFIGAVLKDKNDAPYLKAYAMTDISWDEETKQLYEKYEKEGLEFRNLNTLFGYTLRTGEAVISNNPATDHRAGGLPKGHPPLNAYLGVPIHGKEGLIAMLGVGNRPGGYSEAVLHDLEALIQILVSIIESAKNIDMVSDMAKKDALTNAYNRFYLHPYLDALLSKKNEGEKLCLLMADFNNFKKINDFYGHPAGDDLLVLFVKRIKSILKEKDFIARVGGDEFIIVLDELESYADAGVVAKRIVDIFDTPIVLAGHKIKVGVTIGIACYAEGSKNFEELMGHVDLALYEAKKRGIGFCFYCDQFNMDFEEKQKLEQMTEKALKNNEFYFVYQPEINVKANKVVAIEALLRWKNEDLETQESPERFIHSIQKMGLSAKLNDYVLDYVLSDCRSLVQLNIPIKISINLDLNVNNFKDHVVALIQKINHAKISKLFTFEFELTEESLIEYSSEKSEDIRAVSTSLKEANISLAIDDFAVKHSSMNRLLDYQFDTIKIDKTFIAKLNTKGEKIAKALISAMVQLSRELEINVIAEGVETQEQLTILNAIGVDCIQGYLLARPMPIDKLKKFLLDYQSVEGAG
ncbi:MAG: EAL domain-containing protein [Gammaproteobacteria bacterium]|nr:EAL domain-containing protein [Gammaproteobacteria bacterium]